MWTDVSISTDSTKHARADDRAAAARPAARGLANVRGGSVLGLGYATPFLRPSSGKPSAPWPSAGPAVTRWPRGPQPHHPGRRDGPAAARRSVDRVLLIHAVECTEQVRPMLREIWRVMADGGRLIVAPTRAPACGRDRPLARYRALPTRPASSQRCCAPACSRPYQTRALFSCRRRSRLMMRMAPAVGASASWLGRFAGVSVIRSRQAALCRRRRAQPLTGTCRRPAKAAHRQLARHPCGAQRRGRRGAGFLSLPL